jgi:hypothetical protein
LVPGWPPTLLIDLEKVFGPKKELEQLLQEKKYKRGEVYQFFGEHIERFTTSRVIRRVPRGDLLAR